jgi:hypothetical protein
MADEVAHQEDAEIEALLAMMDSENRNQALGSHDSPETPYGSDDEEYDQLFLDVINQTECNQNRSTVAQDESGIDHKQPQSHDAANGDQDMMDMT